MAAFPEQGCRLRAHHSDIFQAVEQLGEFLPFGGS